MATTRVGSTPGILYLHRGDAAWKGIDFGPLLVAGVVLSGTPTISILPATGLTASSVQRNSSTFSDADAGVTAIVANEGVIAKFDPSAVGRYVVTATCDTDDDQTLAVDVTFVVK